MHLQYHQGMRTTVKLPDSLLKTARNQASKQGLTLSSYIEHLLRQSLNGKRAKKRSAPLKLLTIKGQILNPGLNLDRTSEILTEDDKKTYKE